MKVLFCGSRHWDRPWLIGNQIAKFKIAHRTELSVITGTMMNVDRITREPKPLRTQEGADRIAAWFCDLWEVPCQIVEADWDKAARLYGWRHRGKAGPDRNTKMLELKPDLVMAYRMPGKSNGTDDTVSKAVALGIETIVVDREGAWDRKTPLLLGTG